MSLDSYLDKRDAENVKRIRSLNPKVGMWAQTKGEYGDVWHEIESVNLSEGFSKDYSSMRLYCHRRNEPPVEGKFFSCIRDVVENLPANARVVMCKEGYFSPRSENLDKLPARIKQQQVLFSGNDDL